MSRAFNPTKPGHAVALANNDVALIAWSYDKPVKGCLGFAILRRSSSQPAPTPLPAWVGFRGEKNPNWQPRTTEEWPVQKFSWRDLTAAAGATYTYYIVPMVGKPGRLRPRDDLTLATKKVTLEARRSEHVSAYFNRGILSTQHLVHSLPQGPHGGPSSTALLDHIRHPHDPLRATLAGQIIEALSCLLIRATEEGGECHGALYELNDRELVALLDKRRGVKLVLGNAGKTGAPDATNAQARARLHANHVDVTDRMMPREHIAHDKFLVYLDATKTPRAVMTGSTNWTYTGLCAQANNAILIEDGALAAAYREFWKRLKKESPSGAPARQSQPFRRANKHPHEFAIDGHKTTLWLSPNTKLERKPRKPVEEPSDMARVFELVERARDGILFLLFQPGSPSVLDAIGKAQRAKAGLFVRGAATDPKAIESYETVLHRQGETATVAAAASVKDQFAAWQKELLKSEGAHAIIHDKIVVIDPFSPKCVVVTGSHNLGYRASFNNDENLLIIEGHKRLAEAYAVHVMDVYDHYRWRWQLERKKGAAFTGLSHSDTWQAKYFATPRSEVDFWMHAAKPGRTT
jgi:phosphatidylserine/phosphatidylglycerophosphate/cardiolipin synthase-like enzyme